jgi:hypothetical protein
LAHAGHRGDSHRSTSAHEKPRLCRGLRVGANARNYRIVRAALQSNALGKVGNCPRFITPKVSRRKPVAGYSGDDLRPPTSDQPARVVLGVVAEEQAG